jgi:hypothetical protein
MPGEFDPQTLIARFNAIEARLVAIEDQLSVLSAKADVPYAPPSAGVPAEVVELVRAGKMLDAVAKYRELTNAGFDEARRVVYSV